MISHQHLRLRFIDRHLGYSHDGRSRVEAQQVDETTGQRG
jgi:hypothetical protein